MKFNLSRIQFFLFLFIAQTGTVFISFQTQYIDAAGRDAWIIFIVLGVIHYVLLQIFERNYQYFKPGKFISWLYKAYWLYISVAFLAYIQYTLSVWVFPETPPVVILSIMVGISLYANLSRVETVLNLSVFLIPMILLFIFSLLMAWPEFVWTHLFPIGDSTGPQWLKGMLKAQYTFFGVELYLFFRVYVDVKEKIKGWPLFIYQMLLFWFYYITVLASILFFTIEEMKLIPEPVMYILKSQHVSFVERLDLFFIFIWMIWSVITISLFAFSAIHIHRLHSKGNRKKSIIIYHILLLILPLFMLSKSAMEKVQETTIYVHLMFGIVLPILVILITRRKAR